MSPLPCPSASGARLTGDDLQHLIGWYWALKTLRPELLIQSVAFESLGAGNLDDIEVHPADGEVPQFWQVKATTAATGPVSGDWLMAPINKGKSILQRFWDSFVSLRDQHGTVRLVLATNRSLDPNDEVLKCRGPKELLTPVLRQKGARTAAMKGLGTWADHVGVAPAALLDMLDVLQVRTDVTEASFLERVTDITRLIGLKSDEAAMLAGVGTVRGWIRESRVARTKDDVADVVRRLNLRVAPPSGLLLIQALREIDDAEATASINWVDRFIGEDARSRRGLKDEAEWNASLLPELRNEIGRIRHHYNRVAVRGEARLPIWFVVGSELSEVTSAVVSSVQLGDVWSSDAASTTAPELLITDPRAVGSGSEIAISVAISDDLTSDVLAYATREIRAIGTARTITLATGPNSRAIRNAGEAIAMARQVKELVRVLVREERPTRIHLFLAMPHGLALLLGHLWDRMPPTQLYEDLTGSAYQPAFLITNARSEPD